MIWSGFQNCQEASKAMVLDILLIYLYIYISYILWYYICITPFYRDCSCVLFFFIGPRPCETLSKKSWSGDLWVGWSQFCLKEWSCENVGRIIFTYIWIFFFLWQKDWVCDQSIMILSCILAAAFFSWLFLVLFCIIF